MSLLLSIDYDHENGIPVGPDDIEVSGDVFSTPQSEVRRVTRANKTPATIDGKSYI